MEINIQKFKAVAEAAKAKTADKRWKAAIDKAVEGIESGWIVTELADGIMVTTENGTYRANGNSCQCRAFEMNQPCKHRGLFRLLALYNEEAAPAAVSSPRIVRSIERDVITRRRVKVTRCDGWVI